MTNINMSALGVYLSTVYQHDFFIEIEGRPVSIEKVLQEYKKVKGLEQSDLLTDGVIRLAEDANKFGIEYRIYLKHKNEIPEEINDVLTRNTVYRPEYKYRISLKEHVKPLIMNDGFELGYNYPN